MPTLRGVGITPATNKIEIDRCSSKSLTGASLEFLDSLNTCKGWKVRFDSKNAWIQYNAVDFVKGKFKSAEVNALSQNGAMLQVRLDKADGPILAEVKIPKGESWSAIRTEISNVPQGIHNLFLVLSDQNPVEIDWIRFIR
jgi:hypothetical protein